MTSEPTNEQLMTQIAARDEGALGLLYDRVAPALRPMILQILSSPDESEEVLESVFTALWKSSSHKHGISANPEIWLTLTARRDAVRRLRRRRKLPVLHEQKFSRPADLRHPGAQQLALLSARQGLVRKSLAQLPAPQRKILNLAIFEGYTEEEIAQQLDQPLGRVRDELRAAFSFARQRLHTLMGTWTAGI